MYAALLFISHHAPTPPTGRIAQIFATMLPIYEPVEREDDDILTTDPFFRHLTDLDDTKDHDSTPKPFHDTWRLTPSLMDPNSFAFTSFANQPPGYYTPMSGGINTLYHSQAGDLHTPGMGMHLGTPLSMPHTAHGMPAQDHTMDMHHFHPQYMNPQHFHNPYIHQQQHQHQQPQSYAPSHFLQHQDSGFEAMENSPHKSSPNQPEMTMVPPMQGQILSAPMQATVPTHMPAMGENFRYHVTLNAPTAMIKHVEEIPVTYLNKGQAYTMSVFDMKPLAPMVSPVKYRTFIRISFEDEQQRAKPGSCWQLWKEGRGTNEAHQRGGKLLAVEYVDPNQGGDNDTRRSQIELESASFDGFCVTWVPNPNNGAAECAIAVRFNFLSTDFSHSKGVKGIPVRLCAKTEMIMPSGTESSLAGEPEVCFSKVKLFRDHGAERKLSNDVAHVKKTIEKLKQQINQAEAGMGGFGKRKRSGSMVKSVGARPGKVLKHKRTWSVDSDGEGSGRTTAEEDLHMKLATMQDMFTSTRPASVLYLRGTEQDDPDLFPVHMSGEHDIQPLKRSETWESKASATSSPESSNLVSPSPSSATPATPSRRQSGQPESAPSGPSRISSNVWPEHQKPQRDIEQAVKIPKREQTGAPQSPILALDVDSSYQPPPERPVRPGKSNSTRQVSFANRCTVACFYVRAKSGNKEYYRAIYLLQRTVRDLIKGISDKFQIDPARVARVTHVNSRGLQIVVDEDVVRELPEGQDMVVEFAPLRSEDTIKDEFLQPTSELFLQHDLGDFESAISDPLEMWLNY